MNINTPKLQFVTPSLVVYGPMGELSRKSNSASISVNLRTTHSINTKKPISVVFYRDINTIIVRVAEIYSVMEWLVSNDSETGLSGIAEWSLFNKALESAIRCERKIAEGDRFVVKNPDAIGPRKLIGEVLNCERGFFRLVESDELFEDHLRQIEET